MKYIITKYNSVAIFTNGNAHSDVARSLDGSPEAAGFVKITPDGDQLKATCYGESISLRMRSRPEDSKIVTDALNR